VNEFTIGIVCALMIGAADTLSARLARKMSPLVAMFWSGTIGWLVLAGPVVLVGRLGSIEGPRSVNDVGLLVLGGLFSSVGHLTFFFGLEKSSAGLVSAIASTYPLVVIVVGVSLALDQLHALSGLGVAFVFAGILLLILEQVIGHDRRHANVASHLAVAYGLPTALCWGLGLGVISYAVPSAHWMIVIFVTRGVAVLFSALWLALTRTQIAFSGSLRTWVWLGVIGLAEVAAYLGVSLGARTGSAIVVAAVLSTSPIVTAVLAYATLHESLTHIQIGALLLAVAGVVTLGLQM
jgi:drug/metabolite transporter (DMT)-like permease